MPVVRMGTELPPLILSLTDKHGNPLPPPAAAAGSSGAVSAKATPPVQSTPEALQRLEADMPTKLEFGTDEAQLAEIPAEGEAGSCGDAAVGARLLTGIVVGAVCGVVDQEKDGKKAVTMEVRYGGQAAKVGLLLVCGEEEQFVVEVDPFQAEAEGTPCFTPVPRGMLEGTLLVRMTDGYGNRYRHFDQPRTTLLVQPKGAKVTGRSHAVLMDDEGGFDLTDRLEITGDYGAMGQLHFQVKETPEWTHDHEFQIVSRKIRFTAPPELPEGVTVDELASAVTE